MSENTPADAPVGDPWSPNAIMWVTALLGAFPGLVLHTINERRLGGSRFPFILLRNGLTFVLLFGVLFFAAIPRIIPFVAILVIAVHLKLSQQVRYRTHIASGGERGSTLQASFITIGVLAAVLVAGGGAAELQYRTDSARFESMLAAGDLDGAEQLALRQLAEYPGEFPILWNLARVKAERGDLVGLRRDLRAMLRTYPGDPELLDWLEEVEMLLADEKDEGGA